MAVDIHLDGLANSLGIGNLVSSLNRPELLIEDVVVTPAALWPDDRGYFLEILRFGQGAAGGFPASSTQVSTALTYPGAIKAFHHHRFQTDFWTVASGMFQVALVDLRKDSRTYGLRNTLSIGALRPWQVLIPPGVAHGYKVIGTDPAVLVYATDRLYNPEDEGRIPYNHPGINYDWTLQHK
jgi:dTDP-4-dehydrorhamnose 3,5-epimerase